MNSWNDGLVAFIATSDHTPFSLPTGPSGRRFGTLLHARLCSSMGSSWCSRQHQVWALLQHSSTITTVCFPLGRYIGTLHSPYWQSTIQRQRTTFHYTERASLTYHTKPTSCTSWQVEILLRHRIIDSTFGVDPQISHFASTQPLQKSWPPPSWCQRTTNPFGPSTASVIYIAENQFLTVVLLPCQLMIRGVHR